MAFIHSNRIMNNIEPFLTQLLPPEFFSGYAECFVVFIHYRWSGVIFTAYIVSILTSWFSHEEAICVNKFDRSEVSPEMKDMCLTYPFSAQNEDGDVRRVYALHYKWIPYVFAVALFICFTLQIYVKKIEDGKVKEFTESVSNTENEEQRFYLSECYFSKHLGRHHHLPNLRLYVLLVCLSANLLIFFIMNMTLAGFYLKLPLFLFEQREMSNFSDSFSLAFPPFIECELAPNMQLWMDRTETIGCYLPLMEIYEKMFTSLWLWQTILLLSLIYSLVKEVMTNVILKKNHFKLIHLPNRSQIGARCVAASSSLGDLLLLNKIKILLRASDFQILIENLAYAVREDNARNSISEETLIN